MVRTVWNTPIRRLYGAHVLLLVMSGALAFLVTACRKDVPQEARGATSAMKTSKAVPKESNKVLLVHSYHTGYPWVDTITQGVKRALAGRHVDLEILYMDTKRQTSEEWKKESGERAKRVVAEWRPDVVIAADDNAQQYFAKDYAGQKTPQIVFCGVNAEPEKYGYPASNITGILERPHFAASVGYFLKLVPDAKRIAIVTDDSPTSAAALEFMRQEPVPVQVVSWETPTTFEEWQGAIRRAQETADAIGVYTYHTVKRIGASESMPHKEVIDWTIEHSRIPVLGFVTFNVDDGALCAYTESAVEHGFRAGTIALEILDGKAARDIPMVTAVEGQSVLNLTMARKLGIAVPAGLAESTDIVIEE